MSERVKRSIKIARSIAGSWKTKDGKSAVIMENMPYVYVKTAETKNALIEPYIKASEPHGRVQGYVAQMAFHQWFNGNWEAALPFIDIEIAYWQKPYDQRPKDIRLADAEFNGASIDIKSGLQEHENVHPSKIGLMVRESQFKHDIYVWVLFVPPEATAKFKAPVWIFGYAKKHELENAKIINGLRVIYGVDLHPMDTLRYWNTDAAQKERIGKYENAERLLQTLGTLERFMHEAT
jgi:hypothetical protein